MTKTQELTQIVDELLNEVRDMCDVPSCWADGKTCSRCENLMELGDRLQDILKGDGI